jgi:hypothetical protein
VCAASLKGAFKRDDDTSESAVPMPSMRKLSRSVLARLLIEVGTNRNIWIEKLGGITGIAFESSVETVEVYSP